MRRPWWLAWLAVPAGAGATVIACAGDSITQGGHGRGEDYPQLLESILGSGYEVHNFGKSGTTATDSSFAGVLAGVFFFSRRRGAAAPRS